MAFLVTLKIEGKYAELKKSADDQQSSQSIGAKAPWKRHFVRSRIRTNSGRRRHRSGRDVATPREFHFPNDPGGPVTSADRQSMQFEMAYEMRVVAEKIRFAIRALDAIGPLKNNDISLQLLEALDRLEGLDRRFREARAAGS